MYIDVIRNNKTIKRITEILSDIGFENELMRTPTTGFSLPMEYIDYFTGHEEVKIYLDDICFWGIVTYLKVDNSQGIIDIDVSHIVHEWTYRQISVNHAIKDKGINFVFKSNADKLIEDKETGESICGNNITLKEDIELTLEELMSEKYCFVQAWNTETYERVPVVKFTKTQKNKEEKSNVYTLIFYTEKGTKIELTETINAEEETEEKPHENPSVMDTIKNIGKDKNFAYEGWQLNYKPSNVANRKIDYVYSRQNKLDALTKTCELTPDLYWRVKFTPNKEMDISTFGEKKPYIISKYKGLPNIELLEEPTIDYEFDNVINLATVYSDKSTSGMTSMTLREVYERPDFQIKGFPVVILRANVNNERDYTKYSTQYPTLAPNNEIEYAIIDEDSVRLENGRLMEGTYAFNDLSPFVVDNADGTTKIITDEDRIKASVTAYHEAIKILKNSRRRYIINCNVADLPSDVNVGDRIRLGYDNILRQLNNCGSYFKKMLSINNWFYITKLSCNYLGDGSKTFDLSLEKYLQTNREAKNDIR